MGLNGILRTLLQGWTSLGPTASTSMENAFSNLPGPSTKLPPRACIQQGKDDLHPEDESSGSESSTEKREIMRERSMHTTITSPRINQASGDRSTGTTPSRGKCSNENHDAEIIEGTTEILEEAGQDSGIQSSEKSTKEVAGTSARPTENNGGNNDDNMQSSAEMDSDNHPASIMNTDALVITVPDSDASLSETSTGGDDITILESQMSSQHVDTIIRSEAAGMAARLSGMNAPRAPTKIAESSKKKHEVVKSIVAAELGLLKNQSTPPHSKDVDVDLGTSPTGISTRVG